jgi:3-keto-5-aminohexanoate cleavage enzyme
MRRLPPGAVWQAVVIGRSYFELTAVARAFGGSARTGVEDSLYLRRGKWARDNESLVSRLAGAATILEKKIATVKDAEKEFALVGDPRLFREGNFAARVER